MCKNFKLQIKIIQKRKALSLGGYYNDRITTPDTPDYGITKYNQDVIVP
jgi:hypothetical protein